MSHFPFAIGFGIIPFALNISISILGIYALTLLIKALKIYLKKNS